MLAEALAEGRGKAKAAALRQTKTELTAKRICRPGQIEDGVRRLHCARAISSGWKEAECIPTDGEVVEGMAYVDESAVTGESAPVLKEAGTDMFSFVTAGTPAVSDWLVVRATADPGESFLDRMIHLVEGAKRQKTPNEIALTVLLSILTLIFVIVVAAMAPVAAYLNAQTQRRRPDRTARRADPDDHRRTAVGHRHRRHRSDGALQRARDVREGGRGGGRRADIDPRQDRHHHHGQPPGNRDSSRLRMHRANDLLRRRIWPRFRYDPGRTDGRHVRRAAGADDEPVLGAARGGLDFSAETRMSGSDLADGHIVRKGAVTAIVSTSRDASARRIPPISRQPRTSVAKRGATPLAVSVDGEHPWRDRPVRRLEARHSRAHRRNCARWASAPSW